MPSIAASAVLQRARVKLNDPGGALWTDDILLPHLDAAYDEMQEVFEENDIPVQSEQSSVLTILAGMTALTGSSSPALPSDFLFPLHLYERDIGSTNNADWVYMTPKMWEPNAQQQSTLIWWCWREEEIKFVGATTARSVKIQYKKQLTAITTNAITIPIGRAKSFLASRTAMEACLFIGENDSRAAALQQEAELAMSRLIGRMVKRMQDTPVRRKPFAVGYGRFWGR